MSNGLFHFGYFVFLDIAEVYYIRKRCQSPCDGVGHSDGGNVVMQRNDGVNPHDTRKADADSRDDERDKSIADAAQTAAVDLYRDIQQVPRHDVIDYAHGESYNVGRL